MGGFIPLGDASRRPRQFAVVTVAIILLNVWVFFKELRYGDRFVYLWSAIPIRIVHGHHLARTAAFALRHRSIDAGGRRSLPGNAATTAESASTLGECLC